MSRTALTVGWLSILETISFIALLGAMTAGSETGVSIAGMTHGLLFLAYAVVVFVYREALGWSSRFVALAILTGPIGAIIALERLRRDHVEATSGA